MSLPLAAGSAAQCDTIALSVSPPLVEMTVAQGGDRSFEVTLTNDGDKTFHASAQVADLTLDRHGAPLPLPPGSDAWSLAPWVTLSEDEIEVEPGEQKTLRCRLRVPRGRREADTASSSSRPSGRRTCRPAGCGWRPAPEQC